ncbi:GMC family oxidoreductase [Sphingobium boeckii]|uniref:Choline dehydrogenase-like flavoprotein n=1 Tax=Sphingobium boeckii TaxID=1082345 RepID=A0A7W9EEU4_9SPHN|nr:GMC family oxidoreductase [Sphingobium boeckii]MBB5686537.1 choline dehydrogenase-like flavoprotein [Sphingobium boeckii]
MGRPFNAIHALILRKMTETFFHGRTMAITPHEVIENMQDQFSNIEGDKPQEIGWTILALGLVLGGPLFIWGSPAFRRRRIEKRLQNTKVNVLQDLARLRGIIYAGYYGHWQGNDQDDNIDNPVLNAIGYTLPKHRDRTQTGDLEIKYIPGRDLTHTAFIGHDAVPAETDIIVIGSGAGGGTAAAELARYGHKVLIVEAGPHYPSSRITHEEKRMTARLFVDGAIQSSTDNDLIVFQGRCVGGSTVINNGICLRVKQPGHIHPDAQDVVAKWHQLGAPIDPRALDASYDAVEQAMGIGTIAQRSGRMNGNHLMRGWQAHAALKSDPMDANAPYGWFRKNWGRANSAEECVYCGYCNTGCPYGRKNGMPQSRLRDAVRDGARIMCDAKASEIRWKPRHADGSRTADGVAITLEDGRRRYIRARKGVVVAAGTLASSRLLRDSGVAGAGTGISLNIACPVVALMPENAPQRAWDEDQMTTYVDRGDFLLESHFQPPMSMASLVPGWFEGHFDRMHHYNRLASAGVLFPADRRGQLAGDRLRFKLDREVDLPVLRSALATLCKVHFAAGALEVYPALSRGQTVTRDMDVDAFMDDHINEPDDVTLSSSHPQGGNAIGIDPENSVIGMDFKVHGTRNVMVTDASVMPSCIRVNAQLTTMAMTHYATGRHDPFA